MTRWAPHDQGPSIFNRVNSNIEYSVFASANDIVSFIVAYKAAGFLASLSSDQPKGDLIFDRVLFNNGSFYNPLTGVYTTPYNGDYIITAQVLNFTKFLIKIHPSICKCYNVA